MYKKLCRSKSERIIAGVCGGIGAYLNIDPTLVRLLWIFLIFLGGGGIPAYFIAWLIIPEEY
ncbi:MULTISPECIES: PspC domain-containing protein [unclassified Methanomethylovorans]|uniref:PspC domain-containing protein n=1 Tax=unclassified Methanomethylovorans TaxID=2685044 RepID=UPI0025CC9254|nr:PspC domain-containing protein [Methanomethylovorans sp. PtaU1.Bin093]